MRFRASGIDGASCRAHDGLRRPGRVFRANKVRNEACGMTLSVNNRYRLVLLLFFLLDHLVWLYGGHLEQAAFFYVLLSECVRLGALAALIASFFTPRYIKASVNALMAYCAIMMLLNFWGSYSYGYRSRYITSYLFDTPYYTRPILNILWFKKDRCVPIEHGFSAAAFYMYFLLFAYLFAAKHVPRPTGDKK